MQATSEHDQYSWMGDMDKGGKVYVGIAEQNRLKFASPLSHINSELMLADLVEGADLNRDEISFLKGVIGLSGTRSDEAYWLPNPFLDGQCAGQRQLYRIYCKLAVVNRGPLAGRKIVKIDVEKEIEKRIEGIANRILEIDMINPGIVENVIQDFFPLGSQILRPTGLGDRVLAKMKAIHSVRREATTRKLQEGGEKRMSAHQNNECLTDEEINSIFSAEVDEEVQRNLMKKVNECVFCKRKLILAGSKIT